MPTFRIALLAFVALVPAASAQARWKQIGTTSSGNPVSVDPRTVKRTGSLVSATVRVVFGTPVQTPRGAWASSQTKATVDCTARKLAAKENAYYADAKGSRLVERKVNAIPGYSTTLDGSLGRVALVHLCGGK